MFFKQIDQNQSSNPPRLAMIVAMFALSVLLWIIIDLISGRVIWF